jgi:SAM-dependent methyltransferase
MIKIDCPICGPEVDRKIVYPEKLPAGKVDFSARKNPDFYHFQMVKCAGCGLLYAERIWAEEKIADFYQESGFEYNEELYNLRETYSVYLGKITKNAPAGGNFLEIGCGNGFMLAEALNQGYREVCGFEPAAKAKEAAAPETKDKIIPEIFTPERAGENYFDAVFFAMVIEHITNVNKFLQGIFRCLKPGGAVLGIAHDTSSPLAKLLKDRCPIINDEHIYVFDQETLKKIFTKNGFKILETGPVANKYSLGYWLKMMPMPKALRSWLAKKFPFLMKKNLTIKAGNIFIIAQKPL